VSPITISIGYVGPLKIGYDYNLRSFENVIFLKPLVKNVTEFYMQYLVNESIVKKRNRKHYIIDANVIENIIDLDFPIERYIGKTGESRNFVMPSFFEFANNIYYQNETILQKPEFVSAFVFFTQNILRSLNKLNPSLIVIVDTILSKIVDESGNISYGFKDMFIIESYLYLADAYNNNLLLYVENLKGIDKIIEKILNESNKIGIALNIESVLKTGIPVNIMNMIKYNIVSDIGIGIAISLHRSVNPMEIEVLQKLYSIYENKMFVLIVNAEPFIKNPIDISGNQLHEFIANVLKKNLKIN